MRDSTIVVKGILKWFFGVLIVPSKLYESHDPTVGRPLMEMKGRMYLLLHRNL